MDKASEFIDNLVQKICKGMYLGLWEATDKRYQSIKGVLASGMNNAKEIVSKTPEEWNGDAYIFIKDVNENAVIPVAACFITIIFCLQIINMVQESNNMHNIKPQNMLLVLITMGICLVACSKSFEIVNGLFEVAKWAVDHIPGGFVADTGSLSEKLPLSDNLDTYGFGDVFVMFCNLVLTFGAELFTHILTVAIYIRVNIWYLELLMYMSASAIPFSTFLNKEWGQVGMNYLRKMLAMVFEGFFMLVAFGLYQAIAGRVLNGFTDTSYLMTMITSIGCGVALFMIINKTGSISASIFNAH